MSVTIVENNPGFLGGSSCDYDGQIVYNSQGHLVAVYSKNGGDTDDRLMCRWSKDNGDTWSSRVVLFSEAAQNDGIIDADMPGMWEWTAVAKDNVMYCANHLRPGGQTRLAFFKCDISDVQNIETYSNWMSANGTRVPSLGGGSDGNGYDFIVGSGSPMIDPSLGVASADDIFVTMIKDTAATVIYGTRWNGSAWSASTAIKGFSAASSVGVGLFRLLRNTTHGWVATGQVPFKSTNLTHGVVIRCPVGSDPYGRSNWKGMDLAADHDVVFSSATGSFSWPIHIFDGTSDGGSLHVIAEGQFTQGGWGRLWYNRWTSASQWLNGTGLSSAGSRIHLETGGISEPRLTLNSGFPSIAADSLDNVYFLVRAGNGPSGSGQYRAKWDDGWQVGTYTRATAVQDRTVHSTYPNRGNAAVAFLVATSTELSSVVFNGESGTPWWDPIVNPSVSAGDALRYAHRHRPFKWTRRS